MSNNNGLKKKQCTSLTIFQQYSQFTCGLIFIPTSAAKFLSCDRKVNLIDSLPRQPQSDLKRERSLAYETVLVKKQWFFFPNIIANFHTIREHGLHFFFIDILLNKIYSTCIIFRNTVNTYKITLQECIPKVISHSLSN